MELKTGALMALAFDLGAFLADSEALPHLQGSRFARKFGIALQMFDDIGNFYSPPPKGKEDLRNGRPTFIWAVAAEISSEADYSRFVHGAQMLPDESWICSWAELFELKREAKMRASKYLWNTLEQSLFDSQLKNRIKVLFTKLENSYV
jgi:geranylgeranyl pyrophosphate synthase